MKLPFFTQLRSSLDAASQWYIRTPERALERAYKAALMIKAIEDEHFDGNKISSDSKKYRENALSYFLIKLNKYLKDARLSLSEFHSSTSIVSLANQNRTRSTLDGSEYRNVAELENRETQSITLEKLKFIDDVISKYQSQPKRSSSPSPSSSSALMPVSQSKLVEANLDKGELYNQPIYFDKSKVIGEAETMTDTTSFVPRSILSTLDRLKRDFNPKSEEEVVKNFRISQTKTIISIRFILVLILVPLLTQQVTKTFLVAPLVERVRDENKTEIFLNVDLEEEAFHDLQRFEQLLKFRTLVGLAPKLSPEEMEEEVKEKAFELTEEYRHKSANAIKNVFADIFAAGAFYVLLINSRREIEIFKGFIDDVVYGLSDSAKAFIIILFTDVFVGFHSPHGWEVILEGISRHLGLPENRDFNYLFIATFPVILDTIFKYWIFRYLNRISPSAVATYRNMNE
ncbi:proton extrusion protein PcxA [Funiculus sociatus]|uniref:proton extrusion protein PcxA n=1 Tax=Funiculus sociatus TaxID=450527 RepID=UPI003296AE95